MKNDLEVFVITLTVFIWLLSAWESLLQLSRGKIRRLLPKNKKLAERADDWLENRFDYQSVFRVVTGGALALAAAFAFSFFTKYERGGSPTAATVTTTIVLILIVVAVAEIIAKVVVSYFEWVILKITMPLVKVLRYSIFFPVIYLSRFIEKNLEKLHNTNSENDEDKATTEDEIMSWVEHERNGDDGPSPLEEEEKRMIRGIFDLDDTPVREIMTPRVDVDSLAAKSTIEEAKRKFIETGRSRIPLYGENIDEIKGILYAKDFLDDDRVLGKNLSDFCHKPIFIPETKAVGDLLEEIRETGHHFAVVIDEYGGTSGIITLEDLIEEIVGEIIDEYDDETEGEPEPVAMPDGSHVVEGRTLICDVNELLKTDLPEDEDVDTIGGLVCGELGRIPENGEKVVINDSVEATVLKADNRKILELNLKVISDEDD